MQEAIEAGFLVQQQQQGPQLRAQQRAQHELNGLQDAYATTGRREQLGPQLRGQHELNGLQDAYATTGRREQLQQQPCDLYADVAGRATGPRGHRQPRQIVHAHQAFDKSYNAEGEGGGVRAREDNIYSKVRNRLN